MADEATYKELESRVRGLEAQVVTLTQAQGDLLKQLRKFQGLYDLAIAMTTDQSLDENLQLIVDKSREMFEADIAYVALQDETRGDFFKHTASGIRTEAFREVRLPLGKGLGGMVADTQKGCAVEDYFAEKWLDPATADIVAGEGVVSGMAVPIQMESQNLGLLYVFSRSRKIFSQSDLANLSLIGNLAAVEITRKEAENSLRESEERFRFMAETTGDVIYRLKYDSMNYDYLSPGVKSLTGYSQDEITALGFSKLVRRIDLPGEENASPHCLVRDRKEGRTGEYRADYLICTKTGELKWLRDHSFPWRDSSGGVLGSVGILSDITDYRRAEALVRERTADLIESEEKYRTLVENVPLVVYRIRPDGEILFINHFVEELFGYSHLEMLQNPRLWSVVLYDEDRRKIEALRQVSYKEGKELVAEYRVVHKDGHLVYVTDHAIPNRMADGRVGTVDGIIIDVTGRVKLQEQLVRSEGLKTISEVSARLAHEIRNPLVSAGGFARRLLCSMSPEDPNRAKVEIIVKEVSRLEAILRMVLTYIQPLDLHKVPTDLHRIVEAVASSIEARIKEKNVRLDMRLLPGPAEISADQQRMERVIETLFTNALNQIQQEGSLRVSSSRENDVLNLFIRYPAKHLSQDDVEHFFYPFTTFQMAGNSVDLPMSKILINKHGGTIDVRLEKPGEVLVHVSLPLLRE